MSLTKFDNITRNALWLSYGCKCFYCSEDLIWDNLHIDHIVPESLGNKPEGLNKIIAEYGLGDKFELNGLRNLAPCHSRCNQRKGDDLFEKRTMVFYFSLTIKALPKIETKIEEIKQRKNKGFIISKLQSALTSGLITINELKEILLNAQSNNWNATKIKLPFGVEFIDEVYNIFYLDADYSSLYDKKLLIGGVFDKLDLSNDKGEKIWVSTLREWQEANKIGFLPITNASMKMSYSFTFLEELLSVLQKAKMPRTSFISEPWKELDNFDYLSPNILCDFEGRLSQYAHEGLSIGDLIRRGLVSKNESKVYKISLQFEGMETCFNELFRADFNNDGIEDIFIGGWAHAIGGTMGFGFTKILTCYSENHLIEEIETMS